jgi:hypothetical protein
MQFVNNTPAAALCHVGNPDDTDRVMTVTAKVTFVVSDNGEVSIDTDSPYPVQMADTETKLGILPQDIMPRTGEVFEVCCLGKAHAPYRRPTRYMQVSLTVGEVERRLHVFGDRSWIGNGSRSYISNPEPFTEMPITWERAFGGTAEALVDNETSVELRHPFNPLGKGFDPTPDAKTLAKGLKSPKGYPIVTTTRQLPNIESPDALIRRFDDSPKPVCFAPLPLHLPLYLNRFVPKSMDTMESGEMNPIKKIKEILWNDLAALRAPDELLMDIPERHTKVSVTGMTPERDLTFQLPALRFFIDYLFGTKDGKAELVPRLLMLLPEERRFYLVFKSYFSFEHIRGMERCVRLHMEKGWTALAKGEGR